MRKRRRGIERGGYAIKWMEGLDGWLRQIGLDVAS